MIKGLKNTTSNLFKSVCFLIVFLIILQPTLAYPILAQEASLSAEPEVSEPPDPSISPLPVVEPTLVASVEILESPSPEPLVAEVEAPFPDSSPLVSSSPAPDVSPTPSESPATEVSPENSSSSPVESGDQPNAPPFETPSPEPTPEVTPAVSPPPMHGYIEALVIQGDAFRSTQLDQDPLNVSSASLVTDKGDYVPTETVIITGSSLLPKTNYILYISSTGPPAVSFSAQVATNEQGEFIYDYQLDGNYRPNYSVELKDEEENLVASTAFTDSVSSTTTLSDIACVQDQPKSPSGLNCTANDISLASVSAITVNGHGCRFPGDTVNFTADWQIQSNATARYNVGLWFATAGQSSALNGTCSGTSLPSSPNPFFDGGAGTCGDINSGSTGTLSITMTATCNPDSNGFLKLPYCATWQQNNNGACTGPTDAVPGTSSKCNCQDGFTVPITVPPSIEVVKELSPVSDQGLFNLQVNGATATSSVNVGNGGSTGKQTATIGSNTIGETAGTNTSLSDYTSSVVCKDGHGAGNVVPTTGTNPWSLDVVNAQDILCTITNTRINNASITIVKDALPNDAQDFAFTTTGPGLTGFSLDDDSDSVLSDTRVFANLGAGIYSVTEEPVIDWTQGSATCSDGSPVSAISLEEGENVTCTFVNVRDQGKIELQKDFIGDAENVTINIGTTQGGSQVDSDVLSADGTDGEHAVNTGNYFVSEVLTTPANYTNKLACYNDLDNNGAVNDGDTTHSVNTTTGQVAVGEGEDVLCIFTNMKLPTLKVIKSVINDDGGIASAPVFNVHVKNDSIDVDGSPQTGSATGVTYTLSPGTYSVSEDDPSVLGYAQTGIICDGVSTDTVTLAAGDNKICTITNDDIAPTIVLNKVVNNNHGGQAGVNDFGLSVGGVGVDSGQAATVLANTGYAINEAGLPGYGFVSITGDGCPATLGGLVTLDPGQNITCTITNQDQFGHLSVQKTTVPGGELDLFTIQPSGSGTISGSSSGTISDAQDALFTVTPGTYYVTEYPLEGWEEANNDCQGVVVGAGQDITCMITNIKQGRIIIKKETNPDKSPQSFSFTTNYGTGSFSLSDGQSNDSGFLNPGVYSVQEEMPGGWDVDSAICDDVDSDIDRINLDPGEVVTCTFTNIQHGQVIAHKFSDVDGDGIENYDDFPLGGWQVAIYQGAGCVGSIETGVTLNGSGNYIFPDYPAGVYSVSETPQAGWTNTTPLCQEINLEPGQSLQVNFGNLKLGKISGKKFNDLNGDHIQDSGEQEMPDWTITLDKQGDITPPVCPGGTVVGELCVTETNSFGNYAFNGLMPGIYIVAEQQQAGWTQTRPNATYGGQGAQADGTYILTIGSGEEIDDRDFGNRGSGTITVHKNIDNNGDGDTDDEEDVIDAGDWTFDITEGDQDISIGQTKSLTTGTYTISEDQKEGYSLLSWSCSNGQSGTTNSITLDVINGSETICTFTNQLLPSVLSLTKVNDKSGIDVSAGANVLYTLIVTLTGNSLSNVFLTDLPPAGFKYRSGSWTAVSSVRGDLKPEVTTEPTYASPGKWFLGDMTTGEVVTLTYIADIDTGTDPGLYKDLAWSAGESQTESTVLANEKTGFFVGTEVNVVKDIGGSTGVDIVSENISEVLGISTELPRTGINTIWSILAILLLGGGAGFVFIGIFLRRKT